MADNRQNQTVDDQQKKMLRGTAWMTASNFISRLLGVAYLIPWYIWMGEHAASANALFNMGYNIYGIFLLMSTAGINVAVAKQVARYNSMGSPEKTYQLLRTSLIFMGILGLVFSVVMYLGSPLFASMSGGEESLIPVMYSLSLAVLVFPVMSVIRGFFQGLNDMKPYAMSQIAEQLVRVIWMLLTTYFIMQLGSKDYTEAVVQSTFAAFIGMLASFAVLIYNLWRADLLKAIFTKTSQTEKIDSRTILFDTMREAIPFIITGCAIQIFQIIDQMTFSNVMLNITNFSKEELLVIFSYFSSNPNKILMLIIAVATSIGGVGIPLLTENYVKKDKAASAKLVTNSLTMLWVFLLPAVLGATAVAKPLYTIFYSVPDKTALNLFIIAMLTTIVLGLYTVLAPMIQALFQNRNAIKYFLYGAAVKLVLQVPAIWLFHAYGPLLTTVIGLMIPIFLMYRKIQEITGFNHQILMKRAVLVGILTMLMGLSVIVVEILLNLIYPVNDRLSSIVHLVFAGGLGFVIYAYLALITKMIDYVIGKNKAEQLRQRLRLN